MKNYSILMVIFFLTINVIANPSVNSNQETSSKVIITDDSTSLKIDKPVIDSTSIDDGFENYYEPSDDEIFEFGIISNIEDGVYPMFILTLEIPERQMTESFNLNIEAISLDVESLDNLVGKYATIYYLSELENNLHDVHFNGKSLLGEYAPEEDYSTRHITGVLEGAESETVSDLPGEVSITDKNGTKVIFSWYVDSEMVVANGKIVTAYYSIRGNEIITHIQPSLD